MINIGYNTLALYNRFHLRTPHYILSSDFTQYNVYIYIFMIYTLVTKLVNIVINVKIWTNFKPMNAKELSMKNELFICISVYLYI